MTGFEKPNCLEKCPTYASLEADDPERLAELHYRCLGIARTAIESEFTGINLVVCDSPLLQEPDHGIKESVYIDRHPL